MSAVETERKQLFMSHDALCTLACSEGYKFAAVDPAASAVLDSFLDETLEETLATVQMAAAEKKRRSILEEDMPVARKRMRVYLWKQ